MHSGNVIIGTALHQGPPGCYKAAVHFVSPSLIPHGRWGRGAQGGAGSSAGKESACNAGDRGLSPVSGRSPEEGNGNPLQCPCLEKSMDREAW